MRFGFTLFDKTSLFVAVEKENYEIIKILLSNLRINPSIPYVSY